MPNRRDTIRNLVLMVAGLSSLLTAGCTHKNVQAAAPVATPPSPNVRPMTIAPDTDATPPLEAGVIAPALPAPSETAPELSLAPSQVVPPPRRPTAVAPPAGANAEQDTATRPQPPRMAPQLSPGDQANYQHQVDHDAGIATKNLQTVSGKQLNGIQQDLAEKIRSYLAQANGAGKDGDWMAAQNLAHKAWSLSVELINSL